MLLPHFQFPLDFAEEQGGERRPGGKCAHMEMNWFIYIYIASLQSTEELYTQEESYYYNPTAAAATAAAVDYMDVGSALISVTHLAHYNKGTQQQQSSAVICSGVKALWLHSFCLSLIFAFLWWFAAFDLYSSLFLSLCLVFIFLMDDFSFLFLLSLSPSTSSCLLKDPWESGARWLQRAQWCIEVEVSFPDLRNSSAKVARETANESIDAVN